MLVSWLFLASSAVGVVLAANVLWPRRTPGGLAIVSFFAGWLVGELALHALAAQVLVAVVFVALGGAAAWPGFVAVALTVSACVLLVVAHREAARSDEAVDRAFDAALGADADVRRLRSAFDLVRVALPFPVRHPEVESRWHVAFHEVDGVTLRLDVHRARARSERPARAPTLVYVHGGAWMIGHRHRQGLPLMHHMAAHGWVCVSVDYRLSPRATFPDHLVDVKRALAWVREHADELGADPSFVVVVGNSAGAHLAALAALTANDPAYQPGFEAADTSVAACVGFYGIYDFLDRRGRWPHAGMLRLLERHVMKAPRATSRAAYDAASPVARVHPDAPPFLLVHGTNDTLAPVDESRHLVEALRATSRAPALYVELPRAQHAFEIFPSVRAAHVVDGTGRFLELVRARHVVGAQMPEIVRATLSHAI